MEGAYAIPDDVSDINLDKCPHIVCFLDYTRALESKYGTAKRPIHEETDDNRIVSVR
jgi:hypothetical protein